MSKLLDSTDILSRDAEAGTRRGARAVVYSVRVSISIFRRFAAISKT